MRAGRTRLQRNLIILCGLGLRIRLLYGIREVQLSNSDAEPSAWKKVLPSAWSAQTSGRISGRWRWLSRCCTH